MMGLSGHDFLTLLRSFLLVCSIIVLTELTIMVVLEPLFGENHLAMAFVDAGTLIAVCLPAIYVLLIKPMVRNLLERAEADRALQEMEITAKSIQVVAEQRIQHELVERTKVDARAQFQSRILEVVQQAVMATGKGGVVVYWNQFAEGMFGWREQDVLGLSLAEITRFTAEDASAGLSTFGAVKGWSGEARAVRRDGTFFPAYLTCSPIWQGDGTLSGFVYTVLDISERKAAEMAVRDSEEKYSNVVENSPTGIFIYCNGRLRFANQRFFLMIGRTQASLKDLDVMSIVHNDDWPRVQELWRSRLAGVGAARDYECRIIHASGETRWISGRTALIRYEGDSALLGNIQDVTERKRAEQAVLESREALHRLSARLMSAQESERQRVANELHDSIGQTLSAVKFMVERAIVEQESRNNQGNSTLHTVVPMLQDAVEEVRRISMALRPTTLDDLGLLATIAWFVREFQAAYPFMKVERQIEVEEFEVPELLKTNIFRILQEALNNAAKHSEATRVWVTLRMLLGDLQLLVRDNGIGFDQEALRAPSSAGGFGLISMRERAELFGGSLIITSVLHEGTVIHAGWPLLEDPS